ncbi:hypothetical protein FOCC_FOCC013000 [Frankliniella occidentalis]|nr:hypothetical protein FOCC_FOCC013000 [Frankliniella occidentalis]
MNKKGEIREYGGLGPKGSEPQITEYGTDLHAGGHQLRDLAPVLLLRITHERQSAVVDLDDELLALLVDDHLQGADVEAAEQLRHLVHPHLVAMAAAVWLLLALALAAGPRPAQGCMCSFAHPQEQFCRAHFAYVESLCGVTLDEGETYLLMGRVYDGQPTVTLCDFPTVWRKVTVRQRKGLRQQYAASCSCKPRDCPWWGGSHRVENCLIGHSVCTTHHQQQRCNWLRGRVLDDCLRRAGVANVEGEHSWWLMRPPAKKDGKHDKEQQRGGGLELAEERNKAHKHHHKHHHPHQDATSTAAAALEDDEP